MYNYVGFKRIFAFEVVSGARFHKMKIFARLCVELDTVYRGIAIISLQDLILVQENVERKRVRDKCRFKNLGQQSKP